MMKQPLLSIVVPVYNVDKYLSRCIDSLLDQNLGEGEVEIILVNDGSTDNSPEICKRYAGKHSQILYFSQKNQGLSVARNTGMKQARGRYIQFVDSDDFLAPNSLRNVVETAERYHSELTFFQGRFYPQENKKINVHPFTCYKLYDGLDLLQSTMIIGCVWGNIYDATFLRQSCVAFYPGIYHEDVDFNLKLYPKARRIVFTDYDVYRYRVNEDSISRTNDKSKAEKRVLDDLMVVKNIKELAKDKSLSLSLRKFYVRKGNSMIIGSLLALVRNKSSFNSKFAERCLDYAISLGVYPIKGRALTWKSTLLKVIFNNRSVYLLVVKLFAK